MDYSKVKSGLISFSNRRPFLGKALKLKNNKTFIMPTAFGYTFGVVAFLLLILAIGYMNNLLYVFVFLLISMALTSMWTTNKNIDSVQLENLSSTNLYANEENTLVATLKNKNTRASLWDLQIKVRNNSDDHERPVSQIKPFTAETVSVIWKPTQRGTTQLPRLHIQSRFPFHLLVAWKYFQKENSVLVFPERKGQPQLPLNSGSTADKENEAQVHTEGFFRDYRDYQKTDSPTRIAWKKSLKLQKHLVKNFESSGQKKVLIDWDQTEKLLDPETRISQLALWVDTCNDTHTLYSLKVKDFSTPYASGAQHYRHCMQKLALLTADDYA